MDSGLCLCRPLVAKQRALSFPGASSALFEMPSPQSHPGIDVPAFQNRRVPSLRPSVRILRTWSGGFAFFWEHGCGRQHPRSQKGPDALQLQVDSLLCTCEVTMTTVSCVPGWMVCVLMLTGCRDSHPRLRKEPHPFLLTSVVSEAHVTAASRVTPLGFSKDQWY